MEQDDITLDVQEEQEENESAEVAEAPVEAQAEEPKEEGVTLSPAEYRHFKKWEKSQQTPPQPKAEQPQTSQPNVEETVLLAQGMPEELLTQLKKVAAVNNTGLIKAQNDSIFQAIKEKFEKEQKHKDAAMPASRGAGSVKPKKDFTTPGLERDEHKKMFYDTQK